MKENCGIAAVYLKKDLSFYSKGGAVYYLYKMLLQMQNRGQLSTGITTYNPKRLQILGTYKKAGLVNEVFKINNKDQNLNIFERYGAKVGIGHVRYSTSGLEDVSYAQPFERYHGRLWKWFSFCFNGNLANYTSLKEKLENLDYHLVHEGDTEIIMHNLAYQFRGDKKPDLAKVFSNISKEFDGAYNIAFLNACGDLVIARDPLGFKPLCYGENEHVFAAASESSALVNIGIEEDNIKDVLPGEMILIKDDSISIRRFAESKRKAHCMFEYVYFSNPHSNIEKRPVYLVRWNLGKELAKLEKEKIDDKCIAVPVPDTARPAAQAFAQELGIPVNEGLIMNRYVGRTFIEQKGRGIEEKFTALREVLEGKKIFLIEDSIVRGVTSRKIVEYHIKERGRAKEVHFRVSCPPIRYPCFYGIDMPTLEELIAPKYVNNINVENLERQIAKEIHVETLRYQTIDGLIRSIGLPKKDLCLACLNGKYPTPCGYKMFEKAKENFSRKKSKS